MPAIVQVNTSVTQAPAPSALQGTVAFISQGATNTTPGTMTLLTQLSSISTYLNGAMAVTTAASSSGTVTVTAAATLPFTIGDTVYLTIAGASILAFNGTFLCTITTSTQFTYVIGGTGTLAATGTITYTVEDVSELNQMNTTWFAQSGNTSVYVLECGPGNPTDGVNFLNTWIATNPGIFYAYQVPRKWDGVSAFITFLAQFQAPSAKTYFWITTTLATYTLYTSLMKCAILLIEAPAYGIWAANALTALSASGATVTATTATAHGVLPGQWFQISGCTPVAYNGWFLALTGTAGSTLVYATLTAPGAETALGALVASQYASAGISSSECSITAGFFVTASYAPNAQNQVTPFNNSFVYGVTPFPTQGNSALLTTLQAAGVNYISTGAEGGIADATFVPGVTHDNNAFNFWYAIDWVAINIKLNLANAVINGSNNPSNPLLYNQNGINALQSVGAATLNSGISYGLVFGTLLQVELTATAFATAVASGTYNGYAVINAVPLTSYATTNPSNYKAGLYGGFQVSFAPQLGFSNIVVNVDATSFI